jgi:hypothetical protein
MRKSASRLLATPRRSCVVAVADEPRLTITVSARSMSGALL